MSSEDLVPDLREFLRSSISARPSGQSGRPVGGPQPVIGRPVALRQDPEVLTTASAPGRMSNEDLLTDLQEFLQSSLLARPSGRSGRPVEGPQQVISRAVSLRQDPEVPTTASAPGHEWGGLGEVDEQSSSSEESSESEFEGSDDLEDSSGGPSLPPWMPADRLMAPTYPAVGTASSSQLNTPEGSRSRSRSRSPAIQPRSHNHRPVAFHISDSDEESRSRSRSRHHSPYRYVPSDSTNATASHVVLSPQAADRSMAPPLLSQPSQHLSPPFLAPPTPSRSPRSVSPSLRVPLPSSTSSLNLSTSPRGTHSPLPMRGPALGEGHRHATLNPSTGSPNDQPRSLPSSSQLRSPPSSSQLRSPPSSSQLRSPTSSSQLRDTSRSRGRARAIDSHANEERQPPAPTLQASGQPKNSIDFYLPQQPLRLIDQQEGVFRQETSNPALHPPSDQPNLPQHDAAQPSTSLEAHQHATTTSSSIRKRHRGKSSKSTNAGDSLRVAWRGKLGALTSQMTSVLTGRGRDPSPSVSASATATSASVPPSASASASASPSISASPSAEASTSAAPLNPPTRSSTNRVPMLECTSSPSGWHVYATIEVDGAFLRKFFLVASIQFEIKGGISACRVWHGNINCNHLPSVRSLAMSANINMPNSIFGSLRLPMPARCLPSRKKVNVFTQCDHDANLGVKGRIMTALRDRPHAAPVMRSGFHAAAPNTTSSWPYPLYGLKLVTKHRPGLVRPPTIYFYFHDRLEGDMQRYLFEQVFWATVTVAQGMVNLREIT
ncbi:hypothetical protein BKA70DRAFT_1231520 [Coprinopsis sp. MPI-PUGE-AT-0042]|nr:hypothetical protein BKA70DRAFT_1231520 [Coprinopsis sp. MPI-PUGE-AT-0042]